MDSFLGLKKNNYFLFLVVSKYIKLLKIFLLNVYTKNNFFNFKVFNYKKDIFFTIFKKHSLLQFDQLINIFCTDFPWKQSRFILFYEIFSIKKNNLISVAVNSKEFTFVKSLTSIFSSSSWFEREVFEFFGVWFYKNYDLRRLLTDYGFKGFPLRKDFPVFGFYELFYNTVLNKFLYSSINISNNLRMFENSRKLF